VCSASQAGSAINGIRQSHSASPRSPPFTLEYQAIFEASLADIKAGGQGGPRTYEGTGMPFHEDNQTVVKERLFLDQANPDALYDEITVIDHALTRPWTITKRYRGTEIRSG
jgi:hypothetical protein